MFGGCTSCTGGGGGGGVGSDWRERNIQELRKEKMKRTEMTEVLWVSGQNLEKSFSSAPAGRAGIIHAETLASSLCPGGNVAFTETLQNTSALLE